eukprot:TRINITY_DN9293_c0_g1_i1.p1 TRINITY_DN9293_c0_g1~~TRINITY_DN9293_c0_g1_i1.p1  ORF type:complete len:191 (-),score=29.93 TRINITY_DN9293_c0_g1_i1:181-753(-)
MNFVGLDKNSTTIIFCYLDLKSLINLSKTNKRLNEISKKEIIWKNLYRNYYGEYQSDNQNWKEIFKECYLCDVWEPRTDQKTYTLSNNKRTLLMNEKVGSNYITFPAKKKILIRGNKSESPQSKFHNAKWEIKIDVFTYLGIGFIPHDYSDPLDKNPFMKELFNKKGTCFFYHSGTNYVDGKAVLESKLR